MFEHIGETFIRSFIGFALLLLLARWMGKKQIAQLTYFDYVTGITIGSIAAVTAVERNVHLQDSLGALIFWALFTVGLNVVILKSRKLRKMLDGEPCLVICNGQILEKNMKKMNYSLDDLLEELRQKDVFSIKDVQFAVLESSGKLSIQLKPDKQPITRQDMQITSPPQTFQTELIMDGQIVFQNLSQKNLSKEWLISELEKHGVFDLSQVNYAGIDADQTLYIDTREDTNIESFNITD